MNNPKLLSVHTGVPVDCYDQNIITEYYLQLLEIPAGGKRRDRAIRAAMNYSGVTYRHFVSDEAFFTGMKTTQERNDRYMLEALPLGEKVIREGLDRAGVAAHEIDSLVIVSCTGFNVPGLDLLLAQQVGMSPYLTRTQIFGMGCYGAFPGLRRASDSAKARPGRLALMLSLELCSLHLQFDDSIESVVSTSLFSDGASMAIIGDDPSVTNAPTLIDSETYCDYQTMEHMTFRVTDHGFRMYLSGYVPDLLAANITPFVERLLTRNGLHVEDIRFWAVHPGSKKIVEYIGDKLALTDEQMRPSLETLRDYGNMSSATVLFVLDHIIKGGDPQSGDYGVMMAFGPGLTMEAMLIQW